MNNTKAISPIAERAEAAAAARVTAPADVRAKAEEWVRLTTALRSVPATDPDFDRYLTWEDTAWTLWCGAVDDAALTGSIHDPRTIVGQQDRLF